MHELIQILQIYTGARDSLATPLNAEQWEETLNEAKRQSLVGIFNEVIQHLPLLLSPPMKIRVQSALMAEDIATRNSVMDSHCAEISAEFHRMGLECCILKGQGLAKLYPYPKTRSCGDIDVWVKGKAKDTLASLRSRWETGEISYLHAAIRPFEDETEVEVHFRPSWLNNPFTNNILQKFFIAHSDRQFRNITENSSFPVPEAGFNCVFLAIHIYRHLLYEGIGLRQIMDYYYTLLDSSPDDRTAAYGLLIDLKMERFMGAMMFVLHEWFLLPENYLLMPADEKYGIFLMKEIQAAGNFGHFDDRYTFNHQGRLFQRVVEKITRLRHFTEIAPSEVLWAPCFKLRFLIWRKSQ